MRGLAYCQPTPGLELKPATSDLLPIVRLPTTYLPLLQIGYNVVVMSLCVCIFSWRQLFYFISTQTLKELLCFQCVKMCVDAIKTELVFIKLKFQESIRQTNMSHSLSNNNKQLCFERTSATVQQWFRLGWICDNRSVISMHVTWDDNRIVSNVNNVNNATASENSTTMDFILDSWRRSYTHYSMFFGCCSGPLSYILCMYILI